NSFSQFGSQCLEFLFVHNLPVSVVRKNIPKTGNYTISFTVSLSSLRDSLVLNAKFGVIMQRHKHTVTTLTNRYLRELTDNLNPAR
ncbi:hypothetical protein C9426_35350, partial [Serratia sp. S1B]